ncbi:MAG: hypothetical protein OXI60_11065 [Acidiferrobacterales bacterium]|nr:hypothetical protein [Acidiferrobacterales bacterium]
MSTRFSAACLITWLSLTVVFCNLAGASSIEETANRLFKAFTKTNQLETGLDVSPVAGVAVQDYYIALLRPTWGMDVGFSAVSVGGSESPLTGILLENMFTGTRSVIDRSYGIDMRAAPELLFRVGSAELNDAIDRTEALASLQSVIPGVRLSDALLADGTQHHHAVTSAANLEVRMCVLGGELKLAGSTDWIDQLADYSVVMYDQNKTTITDYRHSAAKHPLDLVLEVRDALAHRGIQVQRDDLIALGPLTDGVSVEELSRLRAVFHGLSDDQPLVIYMGFR